MCFLLLSPKEDTHSSPNQDLDCIKFFSFSLIDGYISLVMDTEAQRQWGNPKLCFIEIKNSGAAYGNECFPS